MYFSACLEEALSFPEIDGKNQDSISEEGRDGRKDHIVVIGSFKPYNALGTDMM